jgi:hypothetical protein
MTRHTYRRQGIGWRGKELVDVSCSGNELALRGGDAFVNALKVGDEDQAARTTAESPRPHGGRSMLRGGDWSRARRVSVIEAPSNSR